MAGTSRVGGTTFRHVGASYAFAIGLVALVLALR